VTALSANPNTTLANVEVPWQQSILQGTSAYYSELAVKGVLRPAWADFVSRLPTTGLSDHLDSKLNALAKQIRDNGITYNVYADHAQGTSRPWSLDLLPFIIDQADWAVLQTGIAQRARLLNAMMADVYGKRELLSKGLLPADLVFGHSGYLPQMQGTEPPNKVWLHMVAFDLGRSPDGNGG